MNIKDSVDRSIRSIVWISVWMNIKDSVSNSVRDNVQISISNIIWDRNRICVSVMDSVRRRKQEVNFDSILASLRN